MLYIYDTIELFGALLDEFNVHWKAQLPRRGGLADGVRRSAQTFAEVNDMIPRRRHVFLLIATYP